MAREYGGKSLKQLTTEAPFKSTNAVTGGFRLALAGLKTNETAAALLEAQRQLANKHGVVDNPFDGVETEITSADQMQQNSYIRELERQRQEQQAYASAVAPDVQRVEDIKNISDLGTYVGGVVGATPVTMAPVIGGAIAGRFGGKALGAVAKPLAGVAPTAGAMAGAGATSYDMLYDENVNAQFNDPNVAARSADERIRNARAAAAPGAGLDALLPLGLAAGARRLGLSAKNAAVGAVAGAGVEGATEAAQLGLQNMQLQQLGGTTMQDSALDYLNAGVAGAVGGGAMSGAAAGVGYGLNKASQRFAKPEQTIEEQIDAAAQQVGAQPNPVGDQPIKTMSDEEWAAEWEKAQPKPNGGVNVDQAGRLLDIEDADQVAKAVPIVDINEDPIISERRDQLLDQAEFEELSYGAVSTETQEALAELDQPRQVVREDLKDPAAFKAEWDRISSPDFAERSLDNEETYIEGVPEILENGAGRVTVKRGGREVPFKTFAVSVEDGVAEVGFVEKEGTGDKGAGYEAYKLLGEELAASGVQLQSSSTLQGPGRALWERLVDEGSAYYEGKRFKFGKRSADEEVPIEERRAQLEEARDFADTEGRWDDVADIQEQIDSLALQELDDTAVAQEAVDTLEGRSTKNEDLLAQDPVAYEQVEQTDRLEATRVLRDQLMSDEFKKGTTPAMRKRLKQIADEDLSNDAITSELIAMHNQVVNPKKLSEAVERVRAGGTFAPQSDSQIDAGEKHSFADVKLSPKTAPLRREIEAELLSNGLVGDAKQAAEVAKNIMLLDTLSAASKEDINVEQYAALLEGRRTVKSLDTSGKITETLKAARELEAERLAQGKEGWDGKIADQVRDTEAAQDSDLFNRFPALSDLDSSLDNNRWEESVMVRLLPPNMRERVLGVGRNAPDNVKLDGVARPLLHIATHFDTLNDPAAMEAKKTEAREKLVGIYGDKARVELIAKTYRDLRSAATKKDPRQLDDMRSALAEEMEGNEVVQPMNNADYTLADEREGDLEGTWLEGNQLDAQKDLREIEYMGSGKHQAPFSSAAADKQTAEDREWVGMADYLERSSSDVDYSTELKGAVTGIRAEAKEALTAVVKNNRKAPYMQAIAKELGVDLRTNEGMSAVADRLRTKFSEARADLAEVNRAQAEWAAAKEEGALSKDVVDQMRSDYLKLRNEAVQRHGKELLSSLATGGKRFDFGDGRYSDTAMDQLSALADYPSWVFDDNAMATIESGDAPKSMVRDSLNQLKLNVSKAETDGLELSRQELNGLFEKKGNERLQSVQEERGHRLIEVKDPDGNARLLDPVRLINKMLDKQKKAGAQTSKEMGWTEKKVEALLQGLGSMLLAGGYTGLLDGTNREVMGQLAAIELTARNPEFFPEQQRRFVGEKLADNKSPHGYGAMIARVKKDMEEGVLNGRFKDKTQQEISQMFRAHVKSQNELLLKQARDKGEEEAAGLIRTREAGYVPGTKRSEMRAQAERKGMLDDDHLEYEWSTDENGQLVRGDIIPSKSPLKERGERVIDRDASEQEVKSLDDQHREELAKEKRELESGKVASRDMWGQLNTLSDKVVSEQDWTVPADARIEVIPPTHENFTKVEGEFLPERPRPAKAEIKVEPEQVEAKLSAPKRVAINARQKMIIDQTNNGVIHSVEALATPLRLVDNILEAFTSLVQTGHLDGTRTSAAKKAAQVWVEVLDPKSVFHIGRRALAAGMITTDQYQMVLEKTGYSVNKNEAHTFVGKSTPGFADDFKKAMSILKKDKTMSEQELFEKTGWFRDARGEWRKDVKTVDEYTKIGANLMQMEVAGEQTRNLGKILDGAGVAPNIRVLVNQTTVSMPSAWSLDHSNSYDEVKGVVHVNPVRQILHTARRDGSYTFGGKTISYRNLKILFGHENAKGELVLDSRDKVAKRFNEEFDGAPQAFETAMNDAMATSVLESLQRMVHQVSYSDAQVNTWTSAAIDVLGGTPEAKKLAAHALDPSLSPEARANARLALLELVAKQSGGTIYNADGSVNTASREAAVDILSREQGKDPREVEIRNMLDSRLGTTYPKGSKIAAAEAALTDEQRAVRAQMTEEISRMLGDRVSRQFDILEDDADHGRGAFVEFSSLDGSRVLSVLRFAVSTRAGDLHIARHESVHAFFGMLKGRAKQAVWRDLRKSIVQSSRIRGDLIALYKGEPDVLAQMDPRKNPESYEEEMIAYAFQNYIDGKLNLNPRARNLFSRVVAFVANVFGIATQDQRAAALFDALFAGELNPTDPDKGGYGGRNISDVMRRKDKYFAPTETFRNKLERHAPGVARMADTLFATPTEVLHNSGSKALSQLAEMFSPHMASARNGGFIANRGQRSAQWHNKWARITGKYSEAELAQALAEAQAMTPPSTVAGADVRKLLSDIFAYSKEAGVKRWDPKARVYKDINEMQNYFPRVWDYNVVSKNEKEFIGLMSKHSKMSDEDIEILLREIAENDGRIEILAEKTGVSAGFTPFQASLSNRQFDFINETNAAEFAKFQSKDINDVMSGYIEQAVHRAEYARLFGNRGEVIDKLIQRAAVEDGISPDDIVRTYRYHIDALSGTLGAHSMGRGLRLAQASAITVQNMILLPFAIFSQAIDGLGSSVRTGNIKEAGTAYGQVLKDLVRFTTRDKSYDYAQDVAEMLGVVSQEAAVHAVNSAGTFMMNKGLRNVNRHFFKWNGMAGWNDSMRKAAMVTGIQFLEQHTGMKGGKVDARRFEELGLNLEEAKDLVVRFREGEKRGVAPQFTKKQAQAVYRFVDQAVIRPNASMRASWLSDPRWLIFAHLKQFTYGMHKVTIARAMHEADNDSMASLAILAGYAPVALAADMTKWALLGMNVTDNWTIWDYMRHSVARGGLLGLYEFGTNVAGDAGHGRIPGQSLVGPTVEHGLTLARSLNLGTEQSVDWARMAGRTIPGVKYALARDE